jgi:hypothetical protein
MKGRDVRTRVLVESGWTATLRVRWDPNQFTQTQILHIIQRAGAQIGVGEFRPGHPGGNDLGYGTFAVTSYGVEK